MKIANIKKNLVILAGLATVGLTALPAQALDINGFTRPDDATCWLDPTCSLSRGGHSDVMTIFGPDGSIFQQIFAFGFEEVNNLYYFDPLLVQTDPDQQEFYTALLEPDGVTRSDTFGVTQIPGVEEPIMGFASDPNIIAPPPIPDLTFVETPGGPNPVPEGTDSFYVTIPYNATQYLSPSMQQQGYTATFQSDVPEPASLALVALGLAGLGWSRRKRT